MKIFFSNIGHGINPSRSFLSQINQFKPINKKWLDTFLQYLKKSNPDIIALVEVDSGSIRSRFINEGYYFATRLCYNHRFYYKYDGALPRYLPILKNHGSSIIYRNKLAIKIKHFYLNHGFKKVVIKATFNLRSDKVSLYSVHLSIRKNIRKLQLKELELILSEDMDHKKIIIGDLNLFGGKGELNNFLNNTHLIAYNNDLPTYPSWKPKIKLDYLLTSKDIYIKNFKIENTLLSDHLAFSFEI